MKFSRKQYMNKECSHREYYSQFVNDHDKDSVIRLIGLKRLLNISDPHLNDIPLRMWDSLPSLKRHSDQLKECGEWLSPANKVCIYKEAAKQIIESEKQ